MWEALLPFAYVFNKFEIFSGMTICSEQYILDKTIFDMMRYFFRYPLRLPFWLGISLFSVCAFLMIYSWNISIEKFFKKNTKKIPAKFAQKLYTQKPSSLFGWRQSFFFSGNENFFLHKNTQKSFSHILWVAMILYDYSCEKIRMW